MLRELRISHNSSISHSSNLYPSQLNLNLSCCEEFARAAVPPAGSSESQPWRYKERIGFLEPGKRHGTVALGIRAETRRSKRSKRWVTFPSSSSRCSKELWQCRHDTNRTSVTGESKGRMKGCQSLLNDLGVPKCTHL